MGHDDALKELTRELRRKPPAAVAALPEKQLRDLAAAIRDARHREAAAVAAAGDAALEQLPRLVRGPVKKIVGA